MREGVEAVEEDVRAADSEGAGGSGDDAVHATIHAEVAEGRVDNLRGFSGGREEIIFVAYENLFIGDSDLISVGVKENICAGDFGMFTAKGDVNFDVAVMFLDRKSVV